MKLEISDFHPLKCRGLRCRGLQCHRGSAGSIPFLSVLTFLFAVGLVAFPQAVSAQGLSTYQLTASVGVGGSFDVEPDSDLDSPNLQLSFSMLTQARSLLTVRLGTLDFDSNVGFGSYSQADLTYLTIAGEYRSRGAYFDSGIFLGLGGYSIDGTRRTGLQDDELQLGFTGGVTAEFPIHRHLSIHSELAGHFADFDDAQFFGALNVGVTYHF